MLFFFSSSFIFQDIERKEWRYKTAIWKRINIWGLEWYPCRVSHGYMDWEGQVKSFSLSFSCVHTHTQTTHSYTCTNYTIWLTGPNLTTICNRWAFIDLSAGPFSWGPAVGGEGVRTELSLPNVKKTIGAVAGFTHINLSIFVLWKWMSIISAVIAVCQLIVWICF